MPGQIRVDTKAMKLAYAIMKTPKNQRQNTKQEPSERTKEAWFKDSISSQ